MKKYLVTAGMVLSLAGAVAYADTSSSKSSDKSKGMSEMTKDQRQKMADLHNKMADCLKSDRPLSECRQEMAKGCQDSFGKEGCPMGHHKQMSGIKGDEKSDQSDLGK
jgi:hypothetical protein